MKKLGLISLLLTGVSLAAVGCTSTESTSAPSTAATQQAPQTESSAQVSSVDSSSQTGIAVQSDPTLQQSEPAQVNPETDVIEQPAAQ